MPDTPLQEQSQHKEISSLFLSEMIPKLIKTLSRSVLQTKDETQFPNRMDQH